MRINAALRLTLHLFRHSWDNAYSRELRNYNEDTEDEGTIWFAESNAEDAILGQLSRLEEDGYLCRHDRVASEDAHHTQQRASTASRFVDLGTGNGHLLFALDEEDDDGESWSGEKVGVDYSETSVQLARRIAAQKETGSIRFDQWDLLASQPGDWLGTGFDMALDKGTFDAISLMPLAEGNEVHPCTTYRSKVVPLIKPGCFLCITSCNWTKDELLGWLAPADGELELYSEAKYPTFTFGGQTGQSIVTLVFRKKSSSS